MASIYDTATLARVVENLKQPGSFLLDMFFPNTITFDTEFVAIDVFNGKRRLAPFVNPLVEGKYVEQIGFTTNEYKPPHVKPKTRLDPLRPIRRMMGERIGGGDQTPVQREAANLAFEMQSQVDMITRRCEWMAAQAMAFGSVTIVGDAYPQAVITFGRDSSLSVALAGAARWGQPGVSPAQNIDDWSASVLQSSGFAVTDVVFTPLAWRAFRNDPMVAQIIASLSNGQPNFMAAGTPALNGGQFMGNWGTYRLWRYYEFYVDPVDGIEKPMLANGTVLLGSADIDGTRAFGAVIDPEVGYSAGSQAGGKVPYVPKSWLTHDPGARWLMTQSAPLMIPTRVNASFAATVY